MVTVKRLPEPPILRDKKETWLSSFLEKKKTNPKMRPPSRQYGHQKIRDTLRAMSANKCFYCERKLGEKEDEVDHYVEVAENPTLAFEWHNLYLSCSHCNDKLPNTQIPNAECLDPCNPTENPAEHLTFEDEIIREKAGSEKGLKTIQKYKLDRGELNYLRLRELQAFERFLRILHQNLAGKPLTTNQKEKIASFQASTQAFSLMFKVYSEMQL